jgi:hypothetical protein
MVDKLPFLPDEHHYAIAAVATRSAQLDHSIEVTLYLALLKSPRTAEFLLKNLSQDRIVDLLSAVLTDAVPKSATAIDALIAEIKNVRKERNEILHWLWGKSEGDLQTAVHTTFRPFREERTTSKTAADIQSVADRALEAVKQLIDWKSSACAIARYTRAAISPAQFGFAVSTGSDRQRLSVLPPTSAAPRLSGR